MKLIMIICALSARMYQKGMKLAQKISKVYKIAYNYQVPLKGTDLP